MINKSILGFAFTIFYCFVLPVINGHGGDDFDPDEGCTMIDDRNYTSNRNFWPSQYLWPNGVVYYQIEGGFSTSQRNIIAAGMRLITANTCVRFVQRTNQRSYVSIRTGSIGCFAYLGYRAGLVRPLHLQQPISGRGTCMVAGIVAHELLHSLGFAHEHTRPDRNSFVRINWGFMPSSRIATNFWKYRRSGDPSKICSSSAPTGTNFDDCTIGITSNTYNQPYDFGSVMHYRTTAFGNGRVTIQPIRSTGGVTLGQRSRLSRGDINKVNAAYRCSGSPPPPPACRNRFSFCTRYAAWCRFSSWLRRYCPLSCNTCP